MTVSVVVIAAAAVPFLFAPSAGAASPAGTFAFYGIASPDYPIDIAAAPDGALLVSERYGSCTSFMGDARLERITTSGVISAPSYSNSVFCPSSIARGPGNTMWITTGVGGDRIVRVSSNGTVTGYGDCCAGDIVAGGDGNMWFTYNSYLNPVQTGIGKITPTGTITIYTDSNLAHAGRLAAGPDGNIWFTTSYGGIGRITPTGTVATFYGVGMSGASGIAAGPDGALWFTNNGNGSIGRITIGGTVSVFIDSRIAYPGDMTLGPDGALWFANGSYGNYSIGRITTGGALSFYTTPAMTGLSALQPGSLTAGPDGNVWFTASAIDGSSSAVGVVGTGLPSAPTTPTAQPGNTAATVTWTAPAANGNPIAGYVVTPSTGGVAQAPRTFNSTATTQTITGLVNGKNYTFKVAAINGVGTGPPSPASGAIKVGTPTSPTGVSAAAGVAQATVTWTAPANNGSAITGYIVTPFIGFVAQTPRTFNSTAPSQVVTGLTSGTTYRFKVAAINGVGTGPNSGLSNAVKAT